MNNKYLHGLNIEIPTQTFLVAYNFAFFYYFYHKEFSNNLLQLLMLHYKYIYDYFSTTLPKNLLLYITIQLLNNFFCIAIIIHDDH